MMSAKRIPSILIGSLLALAILSACGGSECYENHSALPLAYFYNSATQQQVSLNNVKIYGVGAPNDSVLYPSQSLNEAYLPFKIWEETTTYVFQYNAMVSDSLAYARPELVPRDTVTFHYTPKEWFVSPACGAMYFFEMKSVDHTSLLIDSIYCNELITNDNIANIKIFFKGE